VLIGTMIKQGFVAATKTKPNTKASVA